MLATLKSRGLGWGIAPKELPEIVIFIRAGAGMGKPPVKTNLDTEIRKGPAASGQCHA